jgi:DNA primase
MTNGFETSKKIYQDVKKLASIEAFLSERNIHPVKKYFDKALYNCPIHSGDKTPSFHVYKKEDGDDFYCFGCKRGGSAISLKSFLDKEKFGKSLIYFCDKLKISFSSKISLDDIIDESFFSAKENNIDIDSLYELCIFRYSKALSISNITLEECLNKFTILQKTYEQRDEKSLKEILNGKL